MGSPTLKLQTARSADAKSASQKIFRRYPHIQQMPAVYVKESGFILRCKDVGAFFGALSHTFYFTSLGRAIEKWKKLNITNLSLNNFTKLHPFSLNSKSLQHLFFWRGPGTGGGRIALKTHLLNTNSSLCFWCGKKHPQPLVSPRGSRMQSWLVDEGSGGLGFHPRD